MRRFLVLIVAVAFATSTATAAQAQSQTVPGDVPGDITSMVADNGDSSVTVTVNGLGGPCGGVRNLEVFVENAKRSFNYYAEGACLAGTTWTTGLVYTATGDRQDSVPVTCSGFSFDYVGSSWVIVIPRSCLVGVPDRIRVEAEGVNYGSAAPGHALTKTLKRGQQGKP